MQLIQLDLPPSSCFELVSSTRLICQDAKDAAESAEEEKGEAQEVVDNFGAGKNIKLHP